MREIEEREEAERNTPPGFDPTMSIEEYIKRVRAWHLRVHGVPHPMDMPFSLRAKMADAMPKDVPVAEPSASPEPVEGPTPEKPARKAASKRRNRQKE